MKEVWKDVVGYENLYLVSNLGRVKTLERKFYKKDGRSFIVKEKIKKQCETSKRKGHSGYLCTRMINENGISKSELVHILVAKAFIPNLENKPTVNHIDGNKHNNNVNNLEWNTYSENNINAVKLGLRPKYCGFLRNRNK